MYRHFPSPSAFGISHSACLRLRNLAILMAVSHKREGLADAVTIPRMIKTLLEGFDPDWRLLLFVKARIYAYVPCRKPDNLLNLARNSLE